jgi:tetratricopeptide (TPR) repeat protein
VRHSQGPNLAKNTLKWCPRATLIILFALAAGQPANAGLAQRDARPAAKTPSAAPARATLTDDEEKLRSLEGLIEQSRFEELAPLLHAYVQEHPASWQGWYQLGYVYFRLHKISASVEALAKSLQLNVNNAEAHKILGLNLTIVSKYDEAQLELEEAARLKPGSAEIRYFLGRVYYVKNVFPFAKREFEEAIRLDPTYMKAYDNLGLTLEAVLDDDGAMANYQKAIELNEKQKAKSEWPYINVSAFYNRKNQAGLALEYSQKAIAINPQSDAAHFEAAKAYTTRKEYEPAARALEAAVRTNPASSRYHYLLSNTYRKLDRIPESQKEMDVFRKLQSDELEAFRRTPGKQKDSAPAASQSEERKAVDVPTYSDK